MGYSEMNVYFIVKYDDRHGNMDTDGNDPNGAVRYFKDNGFSCKAGYWGCPWYFVDIRKKIFKPGRPGVGYGYEIGGHAVTLDEFKTIYDIFKKYEGLPLLKMNLAETYTTKHYIHRDHDRDPLVDWNDFDVESVSSIEELKKIVRCAMLNGEYRPSQRYFSGISKFFDVRIRMQEDNFESFFNEKWSIPKIIRTVIMGRMPEEQDQVNQNE